jgi:phospholipase/lecithinase/hemolysin
VNTLRGFLARIAVLAFVFRPTGFAQPSITFQPMNQTASLFGDAAFRVVAVGDPPLSYQWQFNNADLPGTTNTTLQVTNVLRTLAGNYQVVVANMSGSVTSRVARLTITPFQSMYEFGYSWTDTRGILPDGSHCAWSDPKQFYMNSACNGPMWPEFLSPDLGLAYVPANNYAFCGATTEQIHEQVLRLRPPPKPDLSLYFLWDERTDAPPAQYLGALTNLSMATELNQIDFLANLNTVDRLYAKGARSIVIQNLNGTILPGDSQELGSNTAAAKVFEQTFVPSLKEAINSFSQTHPDVRITLVDVSSKLDEIIAEPGLYGFTKTNIGALEDPTLKDKSFTGPGADYVYWNKRHGTSRLHQLIAAWTLQAIHDDVLEELAIAVSEGIPKIQMNHLRIGRDYTLQESSEFHTWRDVYSFTAAVGTNKWTTAAVNPGPLFYRLEWQP